MMKMHTALTIAGSDSSGGAGIQADLKTMTAHGVYGMSAVTALTAQNTMGVTDILAVPPAFLAAQLDAVFADIPPDAVKIGMVADAALIHVIAEKLDEYDAKNVVVDPVMVATSGARLISEDAVEALVSLLLPRAAIITPNIPEAEVIAAMDIKNTADMEYAAAKIYADYGTAVLMKGGHVHGGRDGALSTTMEQAGQQLADGSCLMMLASSNFETMLPAGTIITDTKGRTGEGPSSAPAVTEPGAPASRRSRPRRSSRGVPGSARARSARPRPP